MKILSPEQIIESFRDVLGDGLLESTIYERETGLQKKVLKTIWIRIPAESIRMAVEHICALQPYPHLASMPLRDCGETVEVIYIFTVFYGKRMGELNLCLRVDLPKSNLRLPTLTDIIPGAIFMERETQEMMGITVADIPDGRRLFLEGVVPEGVHPWRKDDEKLAQYLRVLPGRKPAGTEQDGKNGAE